MRALAQVVLYLAYCASWGGHESGCPVSRLSSGMPLWFAIRMTLDLHCSCGFPLW